MFVRSVDTKGRNAFEAVLERKSNSKYFNLHHERGILMDFLIAVCIQQ